MENYRIIKNWNKYYCNYSDGLGWIKEDTPEENLAYINYIISSNDFVNKNLNIVFLKLKTDIYCSITNKPNIILGEFIEIFSSRELVYHPSFTVDKIDFIHCVWTSLQAYEENDNVLKN